MEEKKSLNFFKRIYYSIFKFDKYDIFLNEKPGIATRYILVLVLLSVLLICIFEVCDFIRIYNRGRNYILENNLPEFKYESGELNFSRPVENRDEETKYYFYANTDNLTEAQIGDIKNESGDYKYSLLLFKDRLIFSVNGLASEHEYKTYANQINIEEFDNQDLIDVLNELSPMKVFGMILGIETISIYIAQIIATFMNILLLFLSACLICRIINLALEYRSLYNISCYSITFPIIVTAIYNIFYMKTNIEINNMDTVYLILAYIYLIASLFIIKQEVSKQKIEIKKSIKNINIEKGKTVEELEKEKEQSKEESKKNKEEKEKKEDKKDSDLSSKKVPNNGEPDGSEI